MKFTAVVAFLAAFVLSANALAAPPTNAHRLARGLPPMPPKKRFTPSRVHEARHAPSSTPTQPSGGSGSCNTGPVQCCNQVQKAGSENMSSLLGLLNIVVDDVEALVGVNCSPIDVLGLGGNSCSAQPVCCENNSHGSLISIGCIPITL